MSAEEITYPVLNITGMENSSASKNVITLVQVEAV